MSWRSTFHDDCNTLAWSVYPVGSGTNRIADEAGNGVQAHALDAAANESRLLSPSTFPVTSGQTLRVSALSRGMGTFGKVGLDWLRADGSYLSGHTPGAADEFGESAEWGQHDYTVVVPAGASLARATFVTSRKAGTTGNQGRRWDDVAVETWTAMSIAGEGGVNMLVNGGLRDTSPGTVPSPWTWNSDGLTTITKAKVCGAAEQEHIFLDGDTTDATEALGGSTFIIEGTGPASGAKYPGIEQRVAVDEGRTYTLRVMYSGMGGSKPAGYVRALSSTGATIQTAYFGGSPLSDRPPDSPGKPSEWQDGWYETIKHMVTPPGTRFLMVKVYATVDSPAAFRVMFDQIGLYEGGWPGDWAYEGDHYLMALPYPTVRINNVRYEHVVRAASWTLGRETWFSPPLPGVATIEMAGDRYEIEPGDLLSIGLDPQYGAFSGRVDDVMVDEIATVSGPEIITRVVATDEMSWLTRPTVPTTNRASEAFSARLTWLAQQAGIPSITYREMSSTPQPPNADNHNFPGPPDHIVAMDYLDVLERKSNTIVQIGPKGEWRTQYRGPINPANIPKTTLLHRDDCPVRLTHERAVIDHIVNQWTPTDGDPVAWTEAIPAGGTSQARYGARPYSTELAKTVMPTRYPDAIRRAVAVPLRRMAVTIDITRRHQPSARLGPFDYVEWRETAWQVLQAAWTVRAENGSVSWQGQLMLDTTQNAVSGATSPTPPATTVRKRATVTLTASEDGYTALSTGGIKAGNGAGDRVLVGRLADGVLARGWYRWAKQTFLGTNRRVVSATLSLTTDSGPCMSWGSSPRVTVKRVTGGWSAGTYDAASGCGFSSSNALVHPGPARTKEGQVSKAHAMGDGRKINIGINAIAQAWLDGAPQRGVAIFGYSESSSANRSAFAKGATLTLVYEYDE